MALTKISTDGVKDDAITKAKIPADQIEASELANNAVDTSAIADQAVTLDKLPHGDTNNDGKFLRANNGADPSFESLPASGISDVVSDTSPQLGGALDTNGSNINFGDSTANGTTVNRLTFGTATNGDLAIWHDGNNSYLVDQGTGELRIRGAEVIKIQDSDSGENMGVFNKNGSVELYHNNVKKLETLTNGVRVQGGILFGSDTADANVLDDYEEGTFDNQNVLNGWGYLGNGSDASAAPTMTYNGGKYVKIGSMVYVHMRIKIGNYNSTSGTLVFGQVPFYADRGGTESLKEQHLGCWMNACASGGENVLAHTYGSSKYYYGIYKRSGTTVDHFTGANGGSGLDIAINGWYRIE